MLTSIPGILQIIVAFVAQCVINNALPAAIDLAGVAMVFTSTMAITFEPRLKEIVTCSNANQHYQPV